MENDSNNAPVATLQGTVKFYNKDKGFGFIHCKDTGKDYYFHITNVVGDTEPKSGYTVEFTPQTTKKGVSAVNINILSTETADNNGRVKCPSCGKSMVPRIMFRYQAPYQSVCPFCGEIYKQFGVGCLPMAIIIIIPIIILANMISH